jgi:diacylglycerol kinase family enzyme
VSQPAPARAELLLVANPAASTYSQRLEAAVARELERAFSVELVRTEQPGHAISIGSAGAGEGGFAAVAVLGGDGVVNEVANGLAGSEVPLLPLPGGRTNVLSRVLGLPRDAREAAASIATNGSGLTTGRIDLGTMNGRHFTFASGVGLSAAANRRLTGRGSAGRRLGGHLFVYEALAVGTGYFRHPPRMVLDVGVDGNGNGRVSNSAGSIEGVTVIAQNTSPLTYLGSRPLPLCEGASLTSGTVSLALLRSATARVAANLTPRILLGRGSAALRLEQVESVPGVRAAHVRTLDGRPLAVEVDGDYVGEVETVEYEVAPRSLEVVLPRRPES